VTLFDTAEFDLNAYLTRIGLAGEDRPRGDLDTLRAIALRHACAIPFENLDPLLRRPVRLDIASIQRKIVHSGRGGWCFEHNILLGTALTALGYDVTGLSARVLWATPPGIVRSRTHMVLHLVVDGTSLVIDCGFGGSTPTAPLRLQAGVEQATPHEPFRLSHLSNTSGEFLLEARLAGEWKALYTFDLQPQVLADYEMSNWYLCNHPESHFLASVVAARVAPDRRYALRNADLSVHYPNGVSERRELAGHGEIRQALEELFHVTVPTGPEVDEAFARLAKA